MFTKFAVRTFLFVIFFCSLFNAAQAQANQYKINPNPAQEDDTLSVSTEEIKLNVMARNDFGHFDPTLVKDDLMVVEDRVPHSIVSLRRVPASVLIVLDTGGEMRLAKNLRTTTEVAINLIKDLNESDALALMQYSDKPEVLCEWTTDKNQVLDLLAQKVNFGRRSRFVEALNLAVRLINNRPNENRHLILVTDGTDSVSEQKDREAALEKLLAANASVHVLSYTLLEQQENAGRSIMVKGGTGRPAKRMPDEHRATLPQPIQDMLNYPTLGTINLDKEMLRKAKERQEDLRQSQTELETLAKETGGVIILPQKLDEMTAKAKEIAGTIDSQYVVTYVPKRALSDSRAGEIREIEIIARRIGLVVQSRRKIVVPEKQK